MAGESTQAAASKVSDVITTYRATRLFKAPPGAHYTSIDFNDSGEFVILARTDDTIQLFNTKAGAHAKELKSQKYGNALARFTHHDTSIIYASTKVDDGIRYLSMHDNSFIRYFRGHTDRVTCLTMSPSNDNFLSASLDNTVKLWDCRSSTAQGQLDFHSPYLTAYDPSGSVIAIASPACQTVHLYDLKNYDKPPFATFDLLDIEKKQESQGQKSGEGWTGMEFSNNGKFVLISTTGSGHYILDAFSGELKHYLHRPSGSAARPAPGDPLNESNPTYPQADACFTPDGQFVVGGNGGQTGLLVWDLRQEGSRAKMEVLEPSCDLPSSKAAAMVSYNPRHNMIVTADREVVMWLPDQDAA
jgi:COMPASS component SWD2